MIGCEAGCQPVTTRIVVLSKSTRPLPRIDKFHIDGVTGPDEYSALVDDNTYTNLAARENLLGAALGREGRTEEGFAAYGRALHI